MTEKEREALITIIAAFPHMSEFQKGYFLGVAESKAGDSELHIEETHREEAVLVEGGD